MARRHTRADKLDGERSSPAYLPLMHETPALYLGPRARMLKVDALAAAIFAAWRPPVDVAARVSPRP